MTRHTSRKRKNPTGVYAILSCYYYFFPWKGFPRLKALNSPLLHWVSFSCDGRSIQAGPWDTPLARIDSTKVRAARPCPTLLRGNRSFSLDRTHSALLLAIFSIAQLLVPPDGLFHFPGTFSFPLRSPSPSPYQTSRLIYFSSAMSRDFFFLRIFPSLSTARVFPLRSLHLKSSVYRECFPD